MLTVENNFIQLTKVIVFSLFITFIFIILYLKHIHRTTVTNFLKKFTLFYRI